jgi:hypothetical protein
MKLSDIARLAVEETPSEKTERLRRSKEIRAGRHPDTGKRLTSGDRKTLKPNDLFDFVMWKETRFVAHDWQWSEFDRAAIKWREHQDLTDRVRLLGSSMSEANRAVTRSVIGSTLDEQIRASIGRPPLDVFSSRNWETNSGTRLAFEPAYRPELYGSPLLHEVDRAMTTQVTALWRDQNDLLRHSTARPFASTFIQDAVMMEREATRMLGIYGRSLVEQPLFLGEYQSNLGLFQSQHLSVSDFQAADLLARVTLPIDLLPGFQFYDFERVERLKTYASAQLLDLEQDFEFDGNPVHVWEAINIANSAGVELPNWAAEQLGEIAERVCEIGDRDSSTSRSTEAELVGKAAGFGKGRGATGQFAAAKQLQRDREIYFAVEEWLAKEKLRRPDGGAKLTSAYSAVAVQYDVTPSTVQRAYQRMSSYVRNADE